jgi:Family of unknown function (DUF6975)
MAMANNRLADRRMLSVAEAQLARVADAGSAGHAWLGQLVDGSSPHAARNLADAVHLLGHLYGNHPGLLDMALSLSPSGAGNDWLQEAADGFERERLYLVRLTSAVGPLPSTPGAAETEATLLAQRHAIETLAKSERRGCALGAAIAFVADWRAVRAVLDKAAARSTIECPVAVLPDDESITRVIDAASDGPASERALGFGGEQLLLQHRGLFDLLEARAAARADY